MVEGKGTQETGEGGREWGEGQSNTPAALMGIQCRCIDEEAQITLMKRGG